MEVELWPGGPQVPLPDIQDPRMHGLTQVPGREGRESPPSPPDVEVDLGEHGLVKLFQGVKEVGKLGYNALMNNSIGGGLEVGAQMGTGFAAAGIGAVQGAGDAMMANGQNARPEPFRTPTGLGGYEPRQSPRAEGLSPGDAYLSGFGDAAEKYTFQPRTEAGKEIIGNIEDAYVEHIQEAWGDEWVGRLVDEGHITPEIATTLRTMPDAAALFLGLKVKHIPGVVRSMGGKAADAYWATRPRAPEPTVGGEYLPGPKSQSRTLAIGQGEATRGGPKTPAPARPPAPVENNLVPRPIGELEIAKSQRGGSVVIPPRGGEQAPVNQLVEGDPVSSGQPESYVSPRVKEMYPESMTSDPAFEAEMQRQGQAIADTMAKKPQSDPGTLTKKLATANKRLSAIFPKQRGGPKPPSTTDKQLKKLDDSFARVSQLTLESENFLKEVLGDEWSWVRVEQRGGRHVLMRDTADGVDPTMDQLRQRAFREGLEPEQFIESVAKLRLRVQEAWDEMGRLGDARDRLIAADRGRGFNDPKVDVASADQTNVTPINNLSNIFPKQRGAIGWHGSTHGRLEAVPEGKTTNNIEDLFSLKNVGSGTGAQVEGFGLYFAPSAGEVQSFRVMAENGWTPSQRRIITDKFTEAYPEILEVEGLTAAQLRRGDEHLIRRLIDDYTGNPGRNENLLADRNGFRKWYDEQGGAGHEFEVDVPDPMIARMIDADQPLANQPESVKVGLRQLFDQYDGTDFDAYAARGNDWKDARNNLLEELDESEKSQMLLEVGIPGVRYFGDSVRGAAKVGEQIGSREKDLLNKMIAAEKAGKPDLVKKLQKKLDGLEAESFAKPNLVLFDPQVIASVKRDGKVVYPGNTDLETTKKNSLANIFPKQRGGPKFTPKKTKKKAKKKAKKRQVAISKVFEDITDFDTAMALARAGKHLRRDKKTGQYIGGPTDIKSPRALGALRKRIDAKVEAGAFNMDWYHRARETAIRLYPDDPQMQELFARATAVYSPQASPDSEVGAFLYQHNSAMLTGTSVKPGTVKQQRNVDRAYRKAPDEVHPKSLSHGSKTGPYADAKDPTIPDKSLYKTANDLWHGRVMGFGEEFSEGFSDAQHGYLTGENLLLADRATARDKAAGITRPVEWTPRSGQAATWGEQRKQKFIKKALERFAEHNKKVRAAKMPKNLKKPEAKQRWRDKQKARIVDTKDPSFLADLDARAEAFAKLGIDDAAVRHSAYITSEARTGDAVNHLRMEDSQGVLINDYTDAVIRLTAKRDPVADSLKLYSGSAVPTQGYYKNEAGVVERNPGFAHDVLVSSKVSKPGPDPDKPLRVHPEVRPADVAVLDFSAHLGAIMRGNEAGAWSKFFPEGMGKQRVTEQNAVLLEHGPRTPQIIAQIEQIAEATGTSPLNYGDSTAFVRFGPLDVMQQKFGPLPGIAKEILVAAEKIAPNIKAVPGIVESKMVSTGMGKDQGTGKAANALLLRAHKAEKAVNNLGDRTAKKIATQAEAMNALDKAMHSTGKTGPLRDDLMKLREILAEGGIPALRAYIRKYGSTGLPSLLLTALGLDQLLGSSESDQDGA